MALGPPSEIRATSLASGQLISAFNYICDLISPLSCKVTYLQGPDILQGWQSISLPPTGSVLKFTQLVGQAAEV